MSEDESIKRAKEKVAQIKKDALEKIKQNKKHQDNLASELEELGIKTEKDDSESK